MAPIVIINIAIEVSCCIMCLVFIVCILVGDNLGIRLNRIFIGVLLSNIAAMLSDALAFYSIDKTEEYFYLTNFVGNFGAYIFRTCIHKLFLLK